MRLISKDNEKIMNRQGRYFLSAKYKKFEHDIKWLTKQQYKNGVIPGNIAMSIQAYYTNKVHPDVPNLTKSICDALKGEVYNDDRQIKQITLEVKEDAEENYFTVSILPLLH